jgi:hypothetical protein
MGSFLRSAIRTKYDKPLLSKWVTAGLPTIPTVADTSQFLS